MFCLDMNFQSFQKVMSASKHSPTNRFQNGDFGSFVVNDRLPSCQGTLEG